MGAEHHSTDYASTGTLGKIKRKEEEVDLLRTCFKLWRPLSVVFLYWILQCERSDILGAFLRSRVSCAPPVPDAKTGRCPRGSVLQDGGCAALPAGSHDWSGSSKCASKFHVVAKATAMGGMLSSFSTICNIVAQIFVGTTLADSWGRKPVMLLSILGSFACCVLLLVSCLVGSGNGLWLVFLGVGIWSLTNAFQAGVMAMASDLTGSDAAQRGVGYAAISVIQHAGILTAYLVGFYILALDLTEYLLVWLVMVCVCVAVGVFSLFVLRETLSLEEAKPMLKEDCGKERHTGGGNWMKQAVSEAVMAFRLISQDAFLRSSMFLVFLGNAAAFGAINITGGYLISVVGVTQAVASLAGVFQPLAVVCGASACTWLLAQIGPFMTYFIGTGIAAAGMAITGLSAVFRASRESFFWTGWVLVGIGWGIVIPSQAAYNSARVPDKNDHGKLFAAQALFSNLGSTVGSLIWTNCIFKSSLVESWSGGLGYFISAVLIALSGVGYVVLYFTIIRRELRERSTEDSTTAL